jgi:HlyD family secretion protein
MILLRKISFWLALAGLVSTATFVLSFRTQLNQPNPPPPVAPPTKPFAHGGIGASGIVEALRENTAIGVPVSGLVTRVFVANWDQVEAGAPLLQLDDRELQAQLPVRTAEVTVAEAQLASLRTQLARVEKLTAAGAAPTENQETLRDTIEVAQAQLAAARAGVTQTQRLLERLTVRAPTAGTLLQVNTRAGEFVAAGAPTPPLVLGDLSRVQVRADVDEQIAPRVKAGRPAVGYLKGDAAHPIAMSFVRIEPFVVPKKSLTGASTERVDTRVLQIIYEFTPTSGRAVYVGQQLDVFIDE